MNLKTPKQATKGTPLTREDLDRYLPKGDPAVRIFKYPYHWYAGILERLDFDRDEKGRPCCWIWLVPSVRFNRTRNGESMNFEDPLVKLDDEPIADSLLESEEFVFTDPLRLIRTPEGMLAIRATEGTAIISVCAKDTFAMKRMFDHQIPRVKLRL